MKTSAKLTFETILALAVLVALAAAPLAARAAHHGKGPPTLAEFDTDGDGFLTEQEFNEGRAARHAKMAEEGRPMKGMDSAPSFADFDADGDGQLSESEFTAGHQKHMAEMRGKHHGRHDGKGKHQGHGHQHGRKAHASFEEIDSNGDGCIDKAELEAHHATES